MIAPKKDYEAYKNTEISTANQKKLIVMLYDGALRFLRTAGENMEPRSYDIVNNNIVKTQDIITELMLSLDMKAGSEIATNLFNIYAWAKKRLLEANIAKDSKIIEEVAGLLEQLRDAWVEIGETKESTSRQYATSIDSIPAEGVGLSIQG